MAEVPKKSARELKAENDLMMAKAAIKVAVLSFGKTKRAEIPEELQEFWNALSVNEWQEHLKLFSTELKKIRKVAVKKILFDLDNYVKDCKKLMPDFRRTKEELLLMVAIGQVDPREFVDTLSVLPNNKEKLDRQIHRQIKELDWEDDLALMKLDELTKELDKERIKKSDIERIEKEIQLVESEIQSRKGKRDELAIKLVEWKARGNMDIAGGDGKFRLDA